MLFHPAARNARLKGLQYQPEVRVDDRAAAPWHGSFWAVDSSCPQLLEGHGMQDSSNHDSPVISQQVWRHAFGESTIEICADGTVLIDGKVVRDTRPLHNSPDAQLS